MGPLPHGLFTAPPRYAYTPPRTHWGFPTDNYILSLLIMQIHFTVNHRPQPSFPITAIHADTMPLFQFQASPNLNIILGVATATAKAISLSMQYKIYAGKCHRSWWFSLLKHPKEYLPLHLTLNNVKICSPNPTVHPVFFFTCLSPTCFSFLVFLPPPRVTSPFHSSLFSPLFPPPCPCLSLVHRVEWVTQVGPLLIFWMYSGVSVPVASVFWSRSVGCCWLFYCLCMSLCLSAQLYSSPHSAAVHPLLPSLSLPLFTPPILSFTLRTPPHSFSPIPPDTCTYIHIKHTYSEASSLPVQLFLFSLILFLPHLFFFPASLYHPPSLPHLPDITPPSRLCLISSRPLPPLNLELCFLVSASLSHHLPPRAPSSVHIS